MIKIKTYKVFSELLLYPNLGLKNNISYVYDILKNESIFNFSYENDLLNLINFIKENDLLFLQEYYVSLFDRQKNFSLYLFEHIHGDSRERGMAMIDLKNLYKTSDVDIPEGFELPDYLPVFLEYLSLLDIKKSNILLGEIVNILSIIGSRLKNVNSPYYIIFFILESLSTVKSNTDLVNKFVNDQNKVKDNIFHKDLDDSKIF